MLSRTSPAARTKGSRSPTAPSSRIPRDRNRSLERAVLIAARRTAADIAFEIAYRDHAE